MKNVEVSSEGLRLDGTWYPRTELKAAFVEKRGDDTILAVWRSSTEIPILKLPMRDEAEAYAVSRALRLDAASTTLEVRLGRPARGAVLLLFGLVVTCVAAMGAFFAGADRARPAPPPAWIIAVLLLTFLSAWLASRVAFANIVVGVEGVTIKEGLGGSAFLPHSAITGIETAANSMTLVLENGRKLRYTDALLSTGSLRGYLPASAVARRIEEAREVYRRLADAAPEAPIALERHGRTARGWVDGLRCAARGMASTTFREASITRDELLRLVETSSAAARDRLAAMVALRSSEMTGDEEPRVRVAIERCAVPELRERMARVLDFPEEDTFAKVLEEVERDEREDEGQLSAAASWPR